MIKPISGFPQYFVSDSGHVYHGTKELHVSIQPSGYVKVYLYKDKKRYVRYLHRIVAEAFIPNPLGLSEVNHKDRNKTNCAVSNLEWCNRQINMEHGKGRAVHQLLNGVIIATYPSISKAAEAVNDKSNGADIHRCIRGERPSAYGYSWEYADTLRGTSDVRIYEDNKCY